MDHKFLIFDDHDNIVYRVRSTLLEFGPQLTLIDDSAHCEVIDIRHDNPHFHFYFDIYAIEEEYRHLARIQRIGPPWHHRLNIESIDGQYTIDRAGGLLSHEYELTKNKKIVAKINRTKSSTLGGVYSVDIAEDVNEKEDPFVLSLIVVMWCTQRPRFHEQSEQE